MKRYHLSQSIEIRGQYTYDIPAVSEFDDLAQAQDHGAALSGKSDPTWKRTGEFGWILMADGLATGFQIYDRKGNES